MDAAYEEKYHHIEDTYWWFLGRRDYLRRAILQRVGKDAAVLEVGCSGGPLLAQLRGAGYTNLRGLDLSPDAIARARQRGLQDVYVMDAGRPDFADATFDFIVASDILEHLAEPEPALAQWRRILKPGGLALLMVPAFMGLWGEHDDVNRHFARYTRRGLTAMLRRQGFEIVTSSYWNLALFAPVGTMRVLKRMLPKPKRPPKDEFDPVPPWVNATLTTMLRWENTLLLAGARFPVGISVLAWVRKPT